MRFFLRHGGGALAALPLFLSAAIAGEEASVASPWLVLHVRPLQVRESFTIRVSADGLVERWNASGRTVTGIGAARMPARVTAPIVEIAGSVPAEGAPGDGTREGDVWVLATGPDGVARVFLEPLAPEPVRRLVDDAERLSGSLEMTTPREHFLRAVPVPAARAARLRAAGRSAVVPSDIAAEAGALFARAAAHPWEFVSVPAGAHDAVLATVTAHDTGGREIYYELEDTSWTQIGLWRPE